MAALAKLQALDPSHSKLADLRARVDSAMQPAEEGVTVSEEPAVEEIAAEDIPSSEVVEEIPVAFEEPAPVEPEAPAIEEKKAERAKIDGANKSAQ